MDRTQLTQVGRALHRLSIEHVAACSPQARGRSERLNRTLQDRLVNELRLAQIATVAPADPASAFVPLATVDLNQILCHEEERVVSADNTVLFDRRAFQLERQRGRRTCAGLRVIIRRHLSGDYSIWRGTQRLGRFPAVAERTRDRRVAIRPMEPAGAVDAKSAPTAPWKTPKRSPQLPQASV